VFLQSVGATVSTLAAADAFGAGAKKRGAPARADTYEMQARGLRILPGQWRPHYAWEQIAWISPSWPSQDYIWLDFPEAIFTSQGLLFLSHVNPPFPTVFNDLPRVPWQTVENGISFERALPNGISFGGSVLKGSETCADLELHIVNGSAEPLNDITLQTCACLRGIAEFGDYTSKNKFVHAGAKGWISLPRAMELADTGAAYRAGWRTSGKRVVDVPVAVALSNEADRLLAFTWGSDTLSLVGNRERPCVHADPLFKNLAPGEQASIGGRIGFFEGKLEDFDYKTFMERLQ
jgi:hypothetical protein